MPAKLIIGGDIVPTKSNRDLFANAETDELIGTELREILHNADFTIFNLEVPLMDKEDPIQKNGPYLSSRTDTITGLKEINPHFFSLANNHILDQGEQGLFSTLKTLNEAKIAYSGAGKNICEASKGFTKEINGIKIGIYCCAEHEFSIATESSAGANPFDPLESLDHVQALKDESDFVVVLYHGGKEHYRYPSPYLRKVCRKIVDKGADLVVCQHSHCIGCKEQWNGGTIIYGQGNFLFDDYDSEFWQTGLLIQVEMEFSGSDISYIPIVKCENKVRRAEASSAKKILEEFEKRSAEIQENGFVEKRYTEFSRTIMHFYVGTLRGRHILPYSILDRIFGCKLKKCFMNVLYGKKKLLTVWNCIMCEAHRELMLEGLKEEMLDE